MHDPQRMGQITRTKCIGEFPELAFAYRRNHQVEVVGGDTGAVAHVERELLDFGSHVAQAATSAIQKGGHDFAGHGNSLFLKQSLHPRYEIGLDIFILFGNVKRMNFAKLLEGLEESGGLMDGLGEKDEPHTVGQPGLEPIHQTLGLSLHAGKLARFDHRIEKWGIADIDGLGAAQKRRGQQGLGHVAQKGADRICIEVGVGIKCFQPKGLLFDGAETIDDVIRLASGGQVVGTIDKEKTRITRSILGRDRFVFLAAGWLTWRHG